MTTRSGDDGNQAAGRHGRLRASHDDREQVITDLKAAFVHGRLTQDELAARMGQALAATTWADLTALTADLPAAPAARRPPGRSRRRKPATRVARAAFLTVPPFATVLAAFLTGKDPVILASALTLMVYWIIWAVAGLQACSNWLDRRSARKSLPPPAAPRELSPPAEEPRPPYRGPLDGLILSEQRPPAPPRPRLNPA